MLSPVKIGVGACVSRVKFSEVEPVAPAELVSLATMVCVPSTRPLGVNDQAPLEFAVTVDDSAAPSTVKWTTALGSAVPLNAALAVILSVAELPVSLTSFSVTVGADGVGGGVGGGALVPGT